MFSVRASDIVDYLQNISQIECRVLRESPEVTLTGFAALTQARENDVSFWVGRVESVTHANGPSNDDLKKTAAGLLFVPSAAAQSGEVSFAENFPNAKNIVAVTEPYHAMVKFLEHFEGNGFTDNMESGVHFDRDYMGVGYGENGPWIHPSAVVEGFVDEGCFVGPGCVVMRGASVGRGCRRARRDDDGRHPGEGRARARAGAACLPAENLALRGLVQGVYGVTGTPYIRL